MFLKSISLSKKVAIVSTVLCLSYAKAFNITSDSEEHVFFFLEANLSIADLNTQISVAAFLKVNFFSKIVIFACYTLIISAQGCILSAHTGVFFTYTSKLALSIFKSKLLVPEISATAVKQFLCVFNASLRARKFKVQRLEFICLVRGFTRSLLVHVLKTAKLAPHLGALYFYAFNFTFKILQLCALVVVLVSFGNSLFTDSSSFEVLLIKHSLGSCHLIVQVQVLLCPINIRNG